VDELMAQRAEDRVGTEVVVLVESLSDEENDCVGRAAHQAPEVDGECVFDADELDGEPLRVGDLVRAVVVDTEGTDLVVSPREVVVPAEAVREAPQVTG
jgi:ribosomal protein S12 methylthiotransferase